MSDIIQKREMITLILHSGAFDRASYALSIAQVSLASGMEAHMMVTFDGLRRFTKGHLSDMGALRRRSWHVSNAG